MKFKHGDYVKIKQKMKLLCTEISFFSVDTYYKEVNPSDILLVFYHVDFDESTLCLLTFDNIPNNILYYEGDKSYFEQVSEETKRLLKLLYEN